METDSISVGNLKMTYSINEMDEVVNLRFRWEYSLVRTSIFSQVYFAITKIPQFRKTIETGTVEDCWTFINQITPFLQTTHIDTRKLRLMLIDVKHRYDDGKGVTA